MAEGLPLTGPTESVAEAVAESVLEEVGQPPKVWADDMDGLLSGLSDEEMEASKARRPRSPSADGGVGSSPVAEAGVSPVARGRKKRRKAGVTQEAQEVSFAVENRYAVLNPDFGGELGAGGDDSLLLGLPEAIAIDSGGQGSGDSGVVPETALSDLASASVLGTDQLVSQLEGHGVEDVDSSSSPEHAFVSPISPNSVDYLVQVVFTADVPAFGRGFWKLNCSVLQDSSFKEDFKAHYEVWVGLKPFFTSLLDWWDCLKTNVRAFAVSFCSTRARASRAAFVGLQRELSSLVAAENRGEAPDQDRMAVVRSDLEAYFKGKARDFFFRCRREKVELGEVCGAYFFKQVRAARAKVVISGLRTEGGTVVHDPAGLVKAASAFYGASFRVGSVDSSKAESFLGFLEGRVPPDIAGTLDGPFSLAELEGALKGLPSGKVPGSLVYPCGHSYQILLEFWLAVPLRRFVAWDNSRPKAESLPPHFHQVVMWSKRHVECREGLLCLDYRALYRVLVAKRGPVRVFGVGPDVWRAIQRPGLSHRMRDLNWLGIHRRLPVRDVLYRHGLNKTKLCPRAGCGAEETLEHVFWECPFAKKVALWDSLGFLVRSNVDKGVAGAIGWVRAELRWRIDSDVARYGFHAARERWKGLYG
ncbi:hypothetical protein DPEC_G00325220 [Dallia pectoralis]|uniref:Uncharacterized protein n=1 Tax=Dallia pectoralis TaxID=75939 RepID=A0ACC2FB63_DALPE|nr:hypothetical protein DPEC_G00325220 [Dallia pectoralis]